MNAIITVVIIDFWPQGAGHIRTLGVLFQLIENSLLTGFSGITSMIAKQ